MIKIKKILTACLVIALIFSLVACGEDSKVKEPSATISNTAKATADSTLGVEKETETPDSTETPINTENPTATPGQGDTDINADSTTEPTDAPTLKTTTAPTKVPTTVPTKTPENVATKAPTAKPTVAPTKTPTAEPVSTVKPTKAPEATKAPTIALPTEDPSVDYSQWGYYGFESLLPAPLPFETEWLSRKSTKRTHNLMSVKSFNPDDAEENIKLLEDYVKSLEAYGYSFKSTSYYLLAVNENGDLLKFQYLENRVCVAITL